jgi:hypothetical protein
MQAMAAMIEQSKKTVDMSDLGATFVNMYTNPFQTGQSTEYVAAPPDGCPTPGFMEKLYGTTTFSGATATSGFIHVYGLLGATTVSVAGVEIVTGVDAMDAGLTMTATTPASDTSNNGLALSYAVYSRFRLLAAGLRVRGTGIDTESGLLYGGTCKRTARTAAATWQGNSIFTVAFDHATPYSIKEGITVRRNPPQVGALEDEPVSVSAAQYIATGESTWTHPIVRFAGLSATTTLYIDWVYYVMVYPSVVVPIATTISPREPEYDEIVAMITHMPTVTSGNTFPSFLRSLWRGARGVAKYVWSRGLSEAADRTIANMVRRTEALIN